VSADKVDARPLLAHLEKLPVTAGYFVVSCLDDIDPTAREAPSIETFSANGRQPRLWAVPSAS